MSASKLSSSELPTDHADLLKVVSNTYSGEDPPGFKQDLVGICNRYLAGIWSQVGVNDIDIKRMTGGFGGKMYLCRLKSSDTSEEVMIKLHGPDYPFNTTKLNRAIICQHLSHKNIGPQVLAVFESGQVMKYYPSRAFVEDDLKNDQLRDELAQKLAMLHYCDAPVDRSNFCQYFLAKFLASINKTFLHDLRAKCERFGCKTLMEFDFRAEIEWAINNMDTFGSPIVFAQLDCRVGNTILAQSGQLFLCDFDLCAYNYRGLDLASMFYTMVDTTVHGQVKDQVVIKRFIASYVDKCSAIVGQHYRDDMNNSVDHIHEEMRKFFLVYILVLLMFHTWEECTRYSAFGEEIDLGMAESNVIKYISLKAELFRKKLNC